MTVTILRNAVKLYWLFFPIERFVFFFLPIYVWALTLTCPRIMCKTIHFLLRFLRFLTRGMPPCSFCGTLFSATRAAIHLRVSLVHAYPFGECTGAGLSAISNEGVSVKCTFRLFCPVPQYSSTIPEVF